MEKLFYPKSIAIIGLSSRPNNIPRLVLENLIRWGYIGRIFGVNSRSNDLHVDGIKMYRDVGELPVIPDLAFVLIPARFMPDTIDSCGRAGVKWMAIPSGGFNEMGKRGKTLRPCFTKSQTIWHSVRRTQRSNCCQHSQRTMSPLRSVIQPSQGWPVDHYAKRRRRPHALESHGR